MLELARVLSGFGLLVLSVITWGEWSGLPKSPWLWLPTLATWAVLLWLSRVARYWVQYGYRWYVARRRSKAPPITEWGAVS